MKKPVLVLIVILCICSCKLDDVGLPQITNNKALDGLWYLKSEIIGGTTGGVALQPDTLAGFTTNDYINFNSDNTVNISISGPPVSVYNSYYSFNSTIYGQTIVVGSLTNPAGTSYTVNKFTADTLILYNVGSQTSAGIVFTSSTTNLYTH